MINAFLKKCLDFFDFRFALGACAYLFFTVAAVWAANTLRLNDWTARADASVQAFFLAARGDALTLFMKSLTFLGDASTVIAVTAVMLTWFWRKGWPAYFVSLILGAGGSAAMVYLMKHTFLRSRPPDAFHLVGTSDISFFLTGDNNLSFPSGHAYISLVFYGFLVYVVMRRDTHLRHKVLVAALCAMVILGVGISRVYLGVHWPSDIVGSWAMGGVWLAIIIWLAERSRLQKS